MSLDPGLRALLDQLAMAPVPTPEEDTPAAGRAMYVAMRDVVSGPQPDIGVLRDVTVDGAAGPIKARIYDSVDGQNRPCMIYFHGGGFVIGDLDSHDTLCRQLALDGGFRVIAVDYRLAPEHRFPAAPDDCIAATKYIVANAAKLGVDPTKLAVAGDSAGGNLATVVARHAAQTDGPKIALQVLIYPVTEMVRDQGSRTEFADGYFLTKARMDWFDAHYTGGGGGIVDERLNPLNHDVPKGLAPAYVITAGFDPLRDEGREYADKLKAAGVPTTYIDYPDQIHGFFNMPAVSGVSRRAITDAANATAKALGVK
ncbi:MAG: alpha/beta hydrolase [Alphaproteobacteria bacterium]|nr:alpha/beta hydrolase [Alphaproteobacteria bacterium]